MSRTLPSAAATGLSRSRRWTLASRRLAMHLVACRAPIALTQLVGCAVLLRIAVQAQAAGAGNLAHGRLPVLIEGVAAAIVAGTCHEPALPRRGVGTNVGLLRLCTALVMTGAAFGLQALGCLAQHLPGGEVGLLRNTVGLCGLGMAGAALMGGGLAWVGPAVVTVLSEVRLGGSVSMDPAAFWLWPTASGGNAAAALGAGAVFIVGAGLLAVMKPPSAPSGPTRTS